MILGAGIDVLGVGRMARRLEDGGVHFLAGVFTPAEIAACTARPDPARHFAARFAAKEAFLKALPLAAGPGARWLDVEVGTDDRGRPAIVLHGDVRAAAERLAAAPIHLSLSSTHQVAVATVVVESHVEGRQP